MADQRPSAEDALQQLLDGNARYVAGATNPRDFTLERARLMEGQFPVAVIVGCADSRVVPEFAFDQCRGQLFVVRVAGNIVTDHGMASIEYATHVLGTPLIMVLGHRGCGAVKATLEAVESGVDLPGHLPELVESIRPAVETAKRHGGDVLDAAIEANVALGVARLRATPPIVGQAVAAERVRVVGAVYDLTTGRVAMVE